MRDDRVLLPPFEAFDVAAQKTPNKNEGVFVFTRELVEGLVFPLLLLLL
jgi:hypothetical protein